MRLGQLRIRIWQWTLFLCFLGLWQMASDKEWINSFIFSSPSGVWHCMLDMISSKALFYHIGITLLETMSSFVLVGIISLAFAIILWWNESISKVLEPYLVVLNSLPKSALAPVLIVWLGANMKTIIVCNIGSSFWQHS